MKNKNHNIRFNMEKEDECRAWELLHSLKVRQMFKSQNRFVIEAVNDYYDRCVAIKNDPYLETREKEDAFAERIVEAVEKKMMSNLPALFGMYMAQMQAFLYPSLWGRIRRRRSAWCTDRRKQEFCPMARILQIWQCRIRKIRRDRINKRASQSRRTMN